MRTIITIILYFLTLSMTVFAEVDKTNALLIDSLRKDLINLDHIQQEKQATLRELKKERLNTPPGHQRVALGEQIGRSYIIQNLDSALSYLRLAYNDATIANSDYDMQRVQMSLYALLPVIGISKEAVDGFESIDYNSINPSLRREYWLAAAELYNAVQRPYPPGPYKDKYNALTLMAIDSLHQYYPTDSPIAHYLTAQQYLLKGEMNLATANFVDVLPRLVSHPELRDIAMHIIVQHYKNRPEYRQSYLNYLLQRCLNSLNRGVIRPQVMAQLGEELINEGYDRIGRQCITLALETPDFSYTSPYSVFDRSYYSHYLTSEAKTMRKSGIVLVVIIVLAAILLGYLIIKIRRTLRNAKRQSEQAHDKLMHVEAEALRTNKNVISLAFLALEQLKDYNVHVLRKLKAGQIKDLCDDVEEGRYIQRQSEKYFEVFDTTFLSNFPNFVEKINALLLPDRQLTLLSGDRFTPELRIAAFMRLGVTDSSMLSQALGLSLNTIYTYRNRLRSRALDRENFEKQVMKIV